MFFSLSEAKPPQKLTASFEDIQENLQQSEKSRRLYLINILPANEQACLIEGTMTADVEEKAINDWIKSAKTVDCGIIIYGKNSDDMGRLEKKRRDLRALGFHDVFIYPGGLFEWLLLQDIYGRELFPTTSYILDILAFRPSRGIGSGSGVGYAERRK